MKAILPLVAVLLAVARGASAGEAPPNVVRVETARHGRPAG
jgi:hypothetical protein